MEALKQLYDKAIALLKGLFSPLREEKNRPLVRTLTVLGVLLFLAQCTAMSLFELSRAKRRARLKL